MRLGAIITAVVASAVFSSTAYATSPSLLTVGAQDRHPEATFSAPGAEDATIYFATRPDRATDGRFLEENVVHLDIMTADEIQTGRWLDSAQLDPGTYYVLLRATDDDCVGDPNCLNGFSAMLTLSVSKFEQTFTGRAKAYRYLSIVDLTLRVNPLGETLRYRAG